MVVSTAFTRLHNREALQKLLVGKGHHLAALVSLDADEGIVVERIG